MSPYGGGCDRSLTMILNGLNDINGSWKENLVVDIGFCGTKNVTCFICSARMLDNVFPRSNKTGENIFTTLLNGRYIMNWNKGRVYHGGNSRLGAQRLWCASEIWAIRGTLAWDA